MPPLPPPPPCHAVRQAFAYVHAIRMAAKTGNPHAALAVHDRMRELRLRLNLGDLSTLMQVAAGCMRPPRPRRLDPLRCRVAGALCRLDASASQRSKPSLFFLSLPGLAGLNRL
jgi:pentatricopeptide repeat protein